MRIVLIYRPELCDTDGDHKPFEGIEVLGVANDDDEAMELIQRVKDEALAEPDSPTTKWQYHIDTA